MGESYRDWMAKHGIVRLERPMGIDANGYLIAEHFDGRVFEVSIYEHGPGDACVNPEKHRSHLGWSPLDGAMQIIEFRLELAGTPSEAVRGSAE